MSAANAWTLLGPDCVLDGQMHRQSTPNGPTIAGRVTALLLTSPTTIFAGTAGGGLWVSTDGGLDWRVLTDGQPCASIGALAFDAPRNRLWIGSGEGNHGGRVLFGQGLFMLDTTTIGQPSPTFARFTNLPAPADFRQLRTTQILLEPDGANPPIVWWATSGGLFRSADSGGAWTAASFTGAPRTEVASMVLCQDGGGAPRLLVALWGGRLYARTGTAQFAPWTTNPGAMPTSTSLGGRIALAVAPSNPKRVYCMIGATNDSFIGLFRSDAGGENWVARSLPNPANDLGQSNYNLFLTVHPTAPDTLLFGEKAVWRSTDGGSSWQDLTTQRPGTHSDQHAAAYDTADPTRVWLGNDGGVWLSTNGGDTWAARNRGLACLQYYAFVHHPQAASVLLAGAQDNGTQRYAGHPGWNLIGDGDGFFCAIDPQEPKYWYASYVYRQTDRNGRSYIRAIKRSDAAGAAWSDRTAGIDPTEYGAGNEPFYVPFVCDPGNTGVLYLGTTRLWRTQNRGDAWTEVRATSGSGTARFSTAPSGSESAANSITNLCVDPNDSTNIYFGTADGRLFHAHVDAVDGSGQARATFRQARSTGAAGTFPPSGYVTDVAVPKLPSGSPPAPIYMTLGSDYLAFSGTTQVALAQGRVWKHDFAAAAPADWTALGSNQLDVNFPSGPNLPHTLNFANAIAIDPTNPQRVFIGCHVGVFESTNGGAAWTNVAAGLPNAPVVDLQFHPTHRLLRAATMGRGIWERPVDALPPPNTTADLYIRDNVIDIGRFTTAASGSDPLAASGTLNWFDAVDLKTDVDALVGGFDRPAGTVDYSDGGALDYIGFQKQNHHALQRTVAAKVHLQVINRGPGAASNVKARVYWTRRLPDGRFAALPAEFWTLFPDGAMPFGSQWQPVAASQTAASVQPGEPHVFTFDFSAPDVDQNLGLLAVTTCDEDPVSETRTDVQDLVTSNKHTALRLVELNASTGSIVAAVLVLVGAAAVVTAIAVTR